MTDQNIAIVQDVLDRAMGGDLSVLDAHPGMHELIPTMKYMTEIAAELHSGTYHEQFSQGDWVALRRTTEVTLNQEFQGMPAGTRLVAEVIGTYRVVDGIIVEQHSQGGTISHE